MKEGKNGRLNLSIKARITLWYAAVLMVICVLAALILLAVSDRAAESYYVSTLKNSAVIMLDEMEVEHGLLEIDDDLEDVPNVYASLFALDGSLVYGRSRVSEPFVEGAVRRTEANGHSWYIHDTLIELPDRESVWLRLYMSSDVADDVYRSMRHIGVWALPLLAIAALAGGYWMTARAFRPVADMNALAASIADGGDLSGRIALPQAPGRDELHDLAGTINGMLDRLERAFEHERRFTADAAHELRTPLNAMRMQGEYALSRDDAREKDEAVEHMLEKNEEMRTLVNQLLLIARMESGQMACEDRCDLALMIAEIAEDMEPIAAERGMAIHTDVAACETLCSRPMLTRAVVNLVDNAIRYGREGGSVRLSLRREGNMALISVCDDGEGMDEETAARVFERFWRADSARSTPGTGVGLSIVQAIAKAHGGAASVESREGEGCCFTVSIPVRAEHKKEA